MSLIRPGDQDFVRALINEGLATLGKDHSLRLTRAGRLVADEIALGLM